MKKTILITLLAAIVLIIALSISRMFDGSHEAANGSSPGPIVSTSRLTIMNKISEPEKDAENATAPTEKRSEVWAERMTSSRPDSFQEVLDAPPNEEIHFDKPILMNLLDRAKLKGVSFRTQDQRSRALTIDGNVHAADKIIYIRGDSPIVVCRIRGKTIDVRVLELRDEGSARFLGHLPKLNYNESRRWWIPDWYKIDNSQFLGFSLEEDGKSEGVIKSNFYLYDLHSKTLRTLVIPPEISPYQQLALIGIDRKTKAIKILDIDGNILYLGY